MGKKLDVEALRREASDLKKSKGIQHAKALDLVAKAHNYEKWTDLVADQNQEERDERKRGARSPYTLRRRHSVEGQPLRPGRYSADDDQPPEGAHLNPYEDPSLVKRLLRP